MLEKEFYVIKLLYFNSLPHYTQNLNSLSAISHGSSTIIATHITIQIIIVYSLQLGN